MSIKSKVLAAAAVLTLAGGLSTAGTVAASAATPQCANKCLHAEKRGVPRVRGDRAFRDPAARRANDRQPGHRLEPGGGLHRPHRRPVNTSYFYANGMVSAAVASHYGGTSTAVQIEYAPYGQPTGLCTAVATTAYQDEGLSLQPCSTPGTTVWIFDFEDSQIPGDFSIINGSTTDFTHPFAMTILGNPAHQLFTPIILQHLIGNPGNVPANQLWATTAARSDRSSGGAVRLGRRDRPRSCPLRLKSQLCSGTIRPTDKENSCLARSTTRRAGQRSGRLRSPKWPTRNSRHCGRVSRLHAGRAGNSSPTARRACS